jgi:transcription initiation factor TFIID TATA-box-binding protein
VLKKTKNKSLQGYQIRNVICTADLKQQVEIARLNDYPWGRFDVVNNYNGRVGYVKDESMDGRTTVFLSGKLISTGARSLEESREQLFRTVYLLKEGGFIKNVSIDPEIRNIVVTFDFNKVIDFQNIIDKKTVIYEPDQFPGLIYKSVIGPTCLIFASGKVVIVGSKTEQQIEHTIQDLKNLIT